MRVELLWWEGCPSTPQARAELERAMREAGIDPATIEMREVRSDEQAERERFPGSPTIRVNGQDVVPANGDPVSLTCRVYTRRDGSVSALPDPQDLRDALERSKA